MNSPEELENKFEKVLSQVRQINPNFAVLSRISNSLNNPDSDMDDIAKLIKSESSLTTDIIRISNSSYYGASFVCVDVETALTRIGFNDVLRVVSLILSKAICSKRLEYYDLSPHQMWSQGVTVSFFMEGFSKLAGLNKSKAATSGVLHNVGRILTDSLLTMFGHQTEWDDSDQLLAEWEEEQIGIHYGEAGARFLKDMEFPEEIQYIIRHHVYPGAALRENPLCQLLRYSVLLLERVGLGFSNPEYEIPDLSNLRPQIDITEEDVVAVIEDANTRYKEINMKVLTGA